MALAALTIHHGMAWRSGIDCAQVQTVKEAPIVQPTDQDLFVPMAEMARIGRQVSMRRHFLLVHPYTQRKQCQTIERTLFRDALRLLALTALHVLVTLQAFTAFTILRFAPMPI
jgi:hypothetical protein